MPTLIQVNFTLDGPWGEEMAEDFADLAASINEEPGFLWKVWIENPTEKASGGMYLFDTEENARAYVAMHTARLAGFGVENVAARYFTVNETLSRLNRATLTPTAG